MLAGLAPMGIARPEVVAATGLAPFAPPVAAPVAPIARELQVTPSTFAPPAGGLQPSVQYQDAVAHQNDRIAFVPGDRVSIGFRPRPADTWQVGGLSPRALPAGRLSGKSMRADVTLKTVTPDVAPAPDVVSAPAVDSPALGPSGAIAADPATWSSTGVDPTVRLAAAVNPGGLRREIFGFLPYWELTASDTTLDWAKLSTVAYFGVGASSTGTLIKTNSDGSTTVGWSGWTSSRMTSVIDAAHSHHTRVVLTVQSFAWTSSQLASQQALLGSATARLSLARQIAAAVHDRGADGVNLDFEPIAAGYADEFTALVRSVRAELDKVAAGYQLTFDATGYIGNYPVQAATAPGGADAIFVMGYDYRSSASSPVGSVAPVGGPLYDVGDTIRAYIALVSPSKLILGVPYYGRAWSTATNSLDASNTSGAKNGTSVSVLYQTAVSLAAQNGRRYDPVEGVAWTAYRRQNCTATYGCVTSWRELYYDDATSLKAKYDLVNGYGLRGAGIWALGYDGARPELYQAIADKFITDSIPPAISGATLSSSYISPNGDGREDSVRMALSVTGLDKWGWLVEPMTGAVAGSAVRSGTSTTLPVVYSWNGKRPDGSAVPDGTYRITLWTADASNNRAQRQFTVIMDTLAPTVGSTASPNVISPNGDHRSDVTTLHWTGSERVTGTGRIIDAAGATVRAWTLGPGTAGTATWDGRDAKGRMHADGRYRYRVDAYDAAGNRTTRDLAINVDRTIASVAWTPGSFDPRAGQTSRLGFRLIRSATVTVAIYQGTTLIRSIWTSRALLATTYRWTWDGKTASGVRVKPGTYSAVVTATSWVGLSRLSLAVTVRPH